MADYWLAPALVTLRDEINKAAPHRDKASDGWIGDRRHSSLKSDHNPSRWPPQWLGVVRALDIDADLNKAGWTSVKLANEIISMLGKHPALGSGAYVIHMGKITSTDRLSEGSRPYTGLNAHKIHIHVSVGKSAAGYNSTAPWNIFEEEDVMNAAQEKKLDKAVADAAEARKEAAAARDFGRRSVDRGNVNTRLLLRVAAELKLDVEDIKEQLKELDKD